MNFPIWFCLLFYAETNLFARNYLKALIIKKKMVTFKFHGTNDCKNGSEDTAKCEKWWKLLVAWQKVCKSACISLQFSLQKWAYWKTSPMKKGVTITGFVHFFEQKIQWLFKDFQGHISHFLKDSIQCKKEPWICLLWFFHNTFNFILKVFLCLLLLSTWESGLDKVSTKIQGLSSTNCNFFGLSRCM